MRGKDDNQADRAAGQAEQALQSKQRADVKPAAEQSFVAAVAAQHGQRLRRFLARRLRNQADLPDIEQEVYVRLLRVERQEMIRSPEAYLITVASHLLYEHALRQSAAPAIVEFDDVVAELQTVPEEEPSQLAERQEQVATLERVLAKLPPRPLAALLMHRMHGFTLEEIGVRLGVSRPMAKKYVARALMHCRQLMQPE